MAGTVFFLVLIFASGVVAGHFLWPRVTVAKAIPARESGPPPPAPPPHGLSCQRVGKTHYCAHACRYAAWADERARLYYLGRQQGVPGPLRAIDGGKGKGGDDGGRAS